MPKTQSTNMRPLLFAVAAASAVVFNPGCTYDSTPPGEDKINDSKPLLMIDATGLGTQRAVHLQYSDSLGTTTVATAAEKTDASGRFLYPLYMARGTRNYSITITVDQNGDGVMGNTGDRIINPAPVSGTFGGDTETKSLKLSLTNFNPI